MLKFTISTKKLKEMIEKVVTVTSKKSSTLALPRLYFKVSEDGILKVFGTDGEQYAEITSEAVFDTKAGAIGIDIEDLKIITKMNGEITLTETSEENVKSANIMCGKKNINFVVYEIDIPSFNMDGTEEHILTVTESWLRETLINLSEFTAKEELRPIFCAINFNTTDKRVEAVDGFKIGMRTLQECQIIKENESVLLNNRCVSAFKKILDKKSKEEVKIYQDEKYIKVSGKNFNYIIRKIHGDYFNVNSVLIDNRKYEFTVDNSNSNEDNILSVMKYNCDLIKNENIPVVFYIDEGKIYTYFENGKYEVLDEIKTENITANNDFVTAFNPKYLVDTFSIIDSDTPLCYGTNSKSPLFIKGNEYRFVVLPVKLKNGIMEKIKNCINKNRKNKAV